MLDSITWTVLRSFPRNLGLEATRLTAVGLGCAQAGGAERRLGPRTGDELDDDGDYMADSDEEKDSTVRFADGKMVGADSDDEDEDEDDEVSAAAGRLGP